VANRLWRGGMDRLVIFSRFAHSGMSISAGSGIVGAARRICCFRLSVDSRSD
jgi:hypothetical protein